VNIGAQTLLTTGEGKFGQIIVNEDQADLDSSFAGTTDANLFYVDAGMDSVRVGTNSSLAGLKFEVQGDATNGVQDGFFVSSAPGVDQLCGNYMRWWATAPYTYGYGLLEFQENTTTIGQFFAVGQNYGVVAERCSFGFSPSINNLGWLRVRTNTGGVWYDRFQVENDGDVIIPNDNCYAKWGTGSDCGIAYDGTNMVINPKLVGSGWISVPAQIKASSATYPVIESERTSTVTNAIRGAMGVKHSTTGNMVDGFGASFEFYIKDSAAVDNQIGRISCIRDGADNNGNLLLKVMNAGTEYDGLSINTSRNVGIGTITQDRKLEALDATNPQLRVTHTDNTHYGEFQADGSGYLTINTSGNKVIITDGLDITLPATGKVLIDGTTTRTGTTPCLDVDATIDTTTATDDVAAMTVSATRAAADTGGTYAIKADLKVGNPWNNEWSYVFGGSMDTSTSAVQNDAAVFYAEPHTPDVNCREYGIFIQDGYDYAGWLEGYTVIQPSATEYNGLFVDGITNDLTASAGISTAKVFSVERDINWDEVSVMDMKICNAEMVLKNTNALSSISTDWRVYYGLLNNDGKISQNWTATSFIWMTAAEFEINDDGQYDTPIDKQLFIRQVGVLATVDNDSTWTDTSGGEPGSTMSNYGVKIDVDDKPILTSGNLYRGTYGLYMDVEANSVGSSSQLYGLYIADASGAATNWAVYDNSGANWALSSDMQDIYIGAAEDAYFYFDGDSFNIVTDNVTATDDFNVNGGFTVNEDGDLTLSAGATVNEFSTDTTMAGNSDTAVPTEKAVKTYADAIYPEGYLNGMLCRYNADDSIIVSSGKADVNRTLVEFTSDQTLTWTVSSASDYYYIMLASNGTLSASTTEPTWNDTLHGLYDGSSNRCLGAVWADATNDVEDFFEDDKRTFFYLTSGKYIIDLITTGNPDGTYITQEATAYFPVSTNGMLVLAFNSSSGACRVYLEAYEYSVGRLRNDGYQAAAVFGLLEIKTSDSRDLKWLGNNTDNNTFTIRVAGYRMQL